MEGTHMTRLNEDNARLHLTPLTQEISVTPKMQEKMRQLGVKPEMLKAARRVSEILEYERSRDGYLRNVEIKAPE
jgi:hypothetical protein